MKVKDLIEINNAIQNAKAKRDLTLRYFPILPDKLGWGTVTDASWANHEDGTSQGAVAIVAFDKKLLEGEIGSLLHRVVEIRKAAEEGQLDSGSRSPVPEQRAWGLGVGPSDLCGAP